MKKLAIAALLALGFMLGSCATNTSVPAPVTGAGGNWEAQLLGGSGEASLLNFVTNFNVGIDGGALTINSFSFINTNGSSCFLTVAGESGTIALTTSASNQVTGSLTYTIASTAPSGNILTLFTIDSSTQIQVGTVTGISNNGALTNGVVTGNWTLTNANNNTACEGQGTFLMCQEAATCTPTT